MAQHIPIQSFTQKVFTKIENGIKRDFSNSRGMKTSMKYIYMGEQEGLEVYTVNRRIGKGFVWGTETGLFEVHFNSKNKEVANIYLVA